MDTVQIGNLRVSRLIIGGNPFSGNSHQNPEMDRRMMHYFTTERIKDTLREAESLGINAFLGRADVHIIRILHEYWDQGGEIRWIAQTCPELGSPDVSVDRAIAHGAKACYIHGGVMDYLLAQDDLGGIPDCIAKIRDAGLPAGVAGHDPNVFRWAEEHLDADFYMCSYYNPTRRDESPELAHGLVECFSDEDRQRMVSLIETLSKPVIHYKILAAGRNDPSEAFSFTARAMRPGDAVCVGIYQEDKPEMLREDVELADRCLRRTESG